MNRNTATAPLLAGACECVAIVSCMGPVALSWHFRVTSWLYDWLLLALSQHSEWMHICSVELSWIG